MDCLEESVQTLLAMGFPSESEIRRALKMAKNDMNDAVDILTNGQILSSHDDLCSPTSVSQDALAVMEEDSQDFPATNLYELEGRVFTDSWSIPYKEDESLAKCMFASIKLLKEGRASQDAQCSSFLDRCLPEAFRKLLNTQAIYKWDMAIQEGVYDMILIMAELVAASLELPSRAEQTYIPDLLLETLSLSFNPDAEYHQKNRTSRSKLTNWDDLLGADKVICHPRRSGTKEYLWLANLVNKFHYHGGMEMIADIICLPKTTYHSMSSLTEPIAACVEQLDPKLTVVMYEKSVKRVFAVVDHLGADDFKDKNIGKACDLLRNTRIICKSLWPAQVDEVDRRRLNLVLKMIKCPHFNAKMNALIEITKMIEDSSSIQPVRGSIPLSALTSWMTDHELLGIILSGSIDQAQYCDKVKRIVEHVGPHLSNEDLEKLWSRTDDQTSHVVDNIHGIFAAAACQFSVDKFTTFTQLLTNNWNREKDTMKEKHVSLLGQIGKETRNYELAHKVVDVMVELSQRGDISRHLVDRCLDEMHAVLNESGVIKEAYKRKLLERCVESIRRGQWVMSALQQLLNLVKNIVKQSMTRAEKARALSDFQKSSEVIKLLVSSLISCHHMAARCAHQLATPLHPDLVLDGKYSHREHVEKHLQCLTFILQENTNYSMSWNRVKELWECLLSGKEACDWDRTQCYTWLTERISELEPEAVINLFTRKLMTGQSCQLSNEGFLCWKTFFEQTNLREANLRKTIAASSTVTVERQELVGLQELWSLCLNVSDGDVAQKAISFLLSNIYINLNSKYKKDSAILHRSFITDCHQRLEALLISLRGGGSVVYTALSQAFYQLTAVASPALDHLPSPLKPQYLLNVERLLLIVEQYVLIVEEGYQSPRSNLPHGASFYGYPLTVYCECENTKETFTIKTHMNESLLSFKAQLGDRVQRMPDAITFSHSELKCSKDQRLLGQLGLQDGQKLVFRYPYSAASVQFTTSSIQSSQSATDLTNAGSASSFSASSSLAVGATSPVKSGNWELERSLPGVIIAQDGQVFKLLYRLAEIGEPKITRRVAALLHLIPTDPAVRELIDNIGSGEDSSLPGSALSTPSHSPSPSPRKVRAASGTTYGSQTSMLSRKSSSSSRVVSLFSSGKAGGSEVSPFRVRYNLEVLSSRIMPVDMPTNHSSSVAFCEQFLSNNGLSYIMQVFQPDYFAPDVESDIWQACYSLALQLLAYMLYGETVRDRRQGVHVPADTAQHMATMEPNELVDMVSCMMRVAWAASIGKLHLSNSMQPVKDHSLYGRLRQNSADSTASSNSEAEITCLHAGVCLVQTDVDSVNTSIAIKAFEILVYCLRFHPSILGSFYTLPCVEDFLLDILTGCCRQEIRSVVCDELKSLADLNPHNKNSELPRHFLLKIVLAARLPYWVSGASTRGSRQRLLSQCLQYFSLRCHLLSGLSLAEQQRLDINISSMLEDEMGWLINLTPSGTHSSQLTTDDVLVTGHLRLLRHLLTCEGVDHDSQLPIVSILLDDFLFPAAKLELSADTMDSLANFSPKCKVPLSQQAAYDVLLELCSHSLLCLTHVSDKLINWHHVAVESSEWEYLPPVEGRSNSGFVGLKNGGATCYMNSVIQQLFMIPGLVDSVLGVDECDEHMEADTAPPNRSVFYEIQQVFGHLMDSQLQYFEPEQLWHVFKLWGQSVNVREQQDAFDFFTSLCDQLDETLKSFNREPIFQQKMQGIFSDQKNCEDCPHKYEREEPFMALNLTVSNPSLEESLHQFVRGELLEGDNAYFCEKCNQKRNAIKRMCIKTLPPVLCIHLKRFSFDWEANRALKFDDFFKFPLELDMGPYTTDNKRAVYELVGMVVHTGQASAGHYYSFIRDRRANSKTNPTYGKWYKFNDTTVDEFAMTEAELATECFGGRYKAKVTEIGNTKLPEDRVRYWNAYLLFYERKVLQRSHGNRRSSRLQMLRKSTSSPGATVRHDSLSELSDLVQQGERQGIFSSKMPGKVQRSVRVKNLEFLRNRNVYSDQYFDFMYDLTRIASDEPSVLDVQMKTSLKFILNTYLRTKETLRGDMVRWSRWFKEAFSRTPATASWFITYIAEDPHVYLVPYLLSCGIKDIREFFSSLLRAAVDNYVTYINETPQQAASQLDVLIETLLALLNREVVDNSKNAHEFFLFFYRYSRLSPMTCDQLMTQDVLWLFFQFLVGKLPDPPVPENLPRRFTTIQTREFGPLHCTMAVLILHLDLRRQTSSVLLEDTADYEWMKMAPNPLLTVAEDSDVALLLSDRYCSLYIREALIALKEMDSTSVLVVVDAVVYLCHMLPYLNDIVLAKQLCLLPDLSQKYRLESLIAEPEAILSIVRKSQLTDSQKSYQLIKLLTSASELSDTVAHFLLSCTDQWQWCVEWLKRKMSEQSWISHSVNSNEESLTKNFQRTVSAQATLDKATAMLIHTGVPDVVGTAGSDMDVDRDSITSEEMQPANPDAGQPADS